MSSAILFFPNPRWFPITCETEARLLLVACGALPTPTCPTLFLFSWFCPSADAQAATHPQCPLHSSPTLQAIPGQGLSPSWLLTCTLHDPVGVTFIGYLTISLPRSFSVCPPVFVVGPCTRDHSIYPSFFFHCALFFVTQGTWFNWGRSKYFIKEVYSF